ncbi:unnamed protein product [Lathyrus sativus]|nr:unnamed protein product [Lathyrus sativus]
MTPVSPNPAGQNDVSPVKQDRPVLFNLLGQFEENHDPKDHKLVLHYGGSSSSSINPPQLHNSSNSSSGSAMVDQSSARDTNLSSSVEMEDSGQINGDLLAKWTSSKMRLMRKLMMPERSYVAARNEEKEIINTSASAATTPYRGVQNERYNQGSPTSRVCAECQTTSTPLWRSGPMGPKSLCNACGIRQRKAIRAEEEAGITSSKTNKEKEKKLLVSKCTQFKKKNKTASAAATTTTTGGSSSEEMEERLELFVSRVRETSGLEDTTEDVVDYALLLMDISCGYVYP